MEALDHNIRKELSEKLSSNKLYLGSGRGAARFRNKQIAEAVSSLESTADLIRVEELLVAQGALTLQHEKKTVVDIDKSEASVTVLRAALTDSWPMGTHYWVRDNALIAGRLLALEHSPEQNVFGKELLLSALTLISTVKQLERFVGLIEGDQDYRQDAVNWPYIFFEIKSNLNTAQKEKWMHIQDAWQMLALYTLRSLRTEKLTTSELTESHITFLSLLLPLFLKIELTDYENAGSWEELVAKRTSVLIWEYSILNEIALCGEKSGFEFLFKDSSIDDCKKLLVDVEKELGARFPFESGGYDKADPRYREADSALIALLYLDFAKEEKQEQVLLQLIESLKDERCGGYRRYLGDSYQRCGFFQPSTVKSLREFYGAPSGDASGADEFVARDKLVPKGPEAAWLHFIFQLSWWAGKRFRETGQRRYFDLQREKLLDGLALITGEGEHTLSVDEDGEVSVTPVPPFRIPECYITDTDPDGNELLFPSPHTPLNWAVGEAFAAIDMMKCSFELF